MADEIEKGDFVTFGERALTWQVMAVFESAKEVVNTDGVEHQVWHNPNRPVKVANLISGNSTIIRRNISLSRLKLHTKGTP